MIFSLTSSSYFLQNMYMLMCICCTRVTMLAYCRVLEVNMTFERDMCVMWLMGSL